MPQLDTEYYISQLFWLSLCFGMLYIAMRYFVLPKATAIITKRERFVLDGLARAELLRAEIDDLRTKLSVQTAQNRQEIESEYKEVISQESLKMKHSIAQLNKKLFAQEMHAEQQVYKTLREDEEVNRKQSRVIASIFLSKILGKNISSQDLKQEDIGGRG